MLKSSHHIIMSIDEIETDMEVAFFILTKHNIPSSFLQSSPSIELIWVRVHLKYRQDIILGCFYCPSTAPISVLDDLQTSLHDIKSAYPTAKIFLVGDFNSPGINWSDSTLSESYVLVSFREKLIEVTDEFHLEQLVLEPTRQYNTLNLCFTSHPSLNTSHYKIK